ncbi:CDP-diacylglycerol--serine O-phosphatidyltransferase [Pantoea sp. Nvir]|uniref:CDP-diacylglycerol--serine O-phosphatidyltransferase n=1 Tax=Pantoea sp. Nvir TaxID=2576760 RepID=UPI00135B301A|nr:CDP-diacylglycerol--serine O-phosphatidyltransferase [Pantoea sp. Nvir]MXP66523.1 CDP-diacylglycerol--serine O-phosphatidyltransferase [Pantoea sp. Nvir]CAJ0992298.1 CDP-diacylglycerol--serine O-phosphatidyltransferase [Pantoea sp. Nvir]
MLSKFKHNKHQKYLAQLPKLAQSVADMSTLYSPAEFRCTLLKKIAAARYRICIVALYMENDDAGRLVMDALYTAKRIRPTLDISILVDWHRAQRGRIGATHSITNADWYCEIAMQHTDINIPVYGIPVNTREVLGVLHLKGFIIDDTLIYSGANINNVYLHQHDKYRYDRYQLIRNLQLVDTMYEWININFKQSKAVNRLDQIERSSASQVKNVTRQFRQTLRRFNYQFVGNGHNGELTVTPLVGLGKHNLLNKTIFHLMPCTEKKLTICTPYFNLPAILVRRIIHLLRKGKEVEIIVGDKTTNDFYIPPDKPFKVIGTLPYLYEINLRRFLSRLQYYVDNKQLAVRIWKDGDNSYHLKGIWVDKEWTLITGNNLNLRAWYLDLENAVLIHDPLQQLAEQREKELMLIRNHTQVMKNFGELESIADYPVKVRKLIRRMRRIRVDRLISRIV